MNVTGFCLFLLLGLLPVAVAADPAVPVIADQFFAQGLFDSARQAYSSAVSDAPNDIQPRLGLIRTLLRLDQWPDAVTQALAATQKFPQNADVHGLLALTLIRAGWQPPYAEEAEQSLTLDPKDYWGQVASGRIADWKGQRAEALRFFRQASATHPEYPDAWLGLMLTAGGKDEIQERQAAVTAYSQLKPQGYPHDHEREDLDDIKNNGNAVESIFKDDPPFQRTTPLKGPTPLAPVTVTVQFAGDYIVFPVTINGRQFHLLFDTGAGRDVTLSRKAAKSLRLTPIAHSFERGVSGRENSDVLKAETMTLGALTYRSIKIYTMSDSPESTDGIFGGNILRDLAMTLDFNASTATFTGGPDAVAPPPLAGDRAISLPFHLYHQHLFIQLVVNKQPLWALLDTGASDSHFSLRVARDQLRDTPERIVHSGSLSQRIGIGNTDKHIDYIASPQEAQVTLSENPPAVLPIPTIGLSVLDHEVSPDMEFEVGMFLGMSSLAYATRLTFDYPHRILTFEYKDPDAVLPVSEQKK